MLVTAAAGGLGALLAQARATPARRVVGAAGPDKVERVTADVAVDYREPAGPTRCAGARGEVTVALDGVGGEAGRTALELLGRGGRHIIFGWSAGAMTRAVDRRRRRRAASPSPPRRAAGGMRTLEERALAAAAAGRSSRCSRRFPLAGAAAAHAALEARETVGKVVLRPERAPAG